jgi:hypothetical protein
LSPRINLIIIFYNDLSSVLQSNMGPSSERGRGGVIKVDNQIRQQI